MGICASKTDQPSSSANVKGPVPKQRKPTRRNPPSKARAVKKGQKVSDTVASTDNQLSPQEAAKLAAEKRLAEKVEKSTTGELGKKLAKEQGKSYKTQLMQQVEQQNLEKERAQLVYD